MSFELAPVVVYTYTRLSHLQQTISALQGNYLAPRSVLYVVSDAAKTEAHKPLVNRIREYVDGVSGFREVVRVYRNMNFGTPKSILDAEEQVISDHGCVISMEDDNVSSPNFLDFINGGLEAYWDDPSIFSVCGYCPPISIPADFTSEYWFHRWNMSWGFAMWKHKYHLVYPLINELTTFKRDGLLRKVRANGGLCITDSLLRDYKKKSMFNDAILCAKMIGAGLSSVIPSVSKISNIGSDGTGVSGSRLANKYEVRLDDRPVTDFTFGGRPHLNEELVTETIRFYNGGMLTRVSRQFGVYHEMSALKHWLKYKVIRA